MYLNGKTLCATGGFCESVLGFKVQGSKFKGLLLCVLCDNLCVFAVKKTF
jgi:hypothetical protein